MQKVGEEVLTWQTLRLALMVSMLPSAPERPEIDGLTNQQSGYIC
jgi:hypothetical protein